MLWWLPPAARASLSSSGWWAQPGSRASADTGRAPAGVGLGGALQVLVEVQYLEAALPEACSSPAAAEPLDHIRDVLQQVIEARLHRPWVPGRALCLRCPFQTETPEIPELGSGRSAPYQPWVSDCPLCLGCTFRAPRLQGGQGITNLRPAAAAALPGARSC